MRALWLILAISLLTGGAACGSKTPSASSTTSCATPAPGTLTAKSVDAIRGLGRAEVLLPIEVTVRLVELPPSFIPEVPSSYDVSMLFVGTVYATVDFKQVNGCNIAISADGKTASIDLPAVTMGGANLDVSRTQVFTSQAVLDQRIRMLMQDDFDGRGKLYEAATAKLKEDAEMPEMIRKAEDELHEILDRGLRPLGFTGTTVTFAQS